MADALIPVNECMIPHQREREAGSLLGRCFLETVPAESHARLCRRRLDGTEIADARRASRCLDDESMQLDNLLYGQIAH